MGDCDPCGNRNGREINPASARDLARELDSGNARTVMDALQRDAYTMQPRQFEQTVLQLAQIENPRLGDNLAVSQRGDIVINRADGQRFCIGNIYRQEDMAASYAQRQDGNYNREVPRQPVVVQGAYNEPYYDQQPLYQPQVATPTYYPDQRYVHHGRNGRVYDQGYDQGFNNGNGFNNGLLGQQVVIDGIRGGITGWGSGGSALKGAGINVGLGILGQVFNGGNGNGRRW